MAFQGLGLTFEPKLGEFAGFGLCRKTRPTYGLHEGRPVIKPDPMGLKVFIWFGLRLGPLHPRFR